MTSRRWRSLAAAAVLNACVVAGCSTAQSSGSPTTSAPPGEVATRLPETAAPTAPPEPTGVPGLSASDPFCSAWAEYAGTLQALGIAASFGGLASDRFAALELVASTDVVEATSQIDASWPAELETEHAVVMDQRIGPYRRRAEHAVSSLADAGATTAEVSTLRAVWHEALLARDPANPVIGLATIDPSLQAKVDAAARSFDAAFTPFANDPSLVVSGVRSSLTDAYLDAHCPDLASSGVGDAL